MSIQSISAHQSYWILANITSCIQFVIVEAVVIQPRLNILILTLILKRNEGGIIAVLPFLPAEDVKLLLPDLVAVVVKCLQGSTEVVRYDGEALAVGSELGSWNERVLLEEPGYDVSLFSIRRNLLPLMQRNIAIPHEVSGYTLIGLLSPPAQRIICE